MATEQDREKEGRRYDLYEKAIWGVVLTPVTIGFIGGLVKVFWREEPLEPLNWYLSGLTGTAILTAIKSSSLFDRLNNKVRRLLCPETRIYYQRLIDAAQKPTLPPTPPPSLPPTPDLGPVPSPIIPSSPSELSAMVELSAVR